MISVGLAKLALFGSLVGGEPSSLDLSWEAELGCPSEVELRGQVAAWIGEGAQTLPVAARGRTVEHHGSYRLELRIDAGARSHTHVLRDHDCAALSERAALLIASALDPFALVRSDPLERLDVAELDVVRVEAHALAAASDRAERPPVQRPRTPDGPTTQARLEAAARPDVPPPESPALGLAPTEFGPLELDRGEARPRPPVQAFLAASALGFAGMAATPGGGVELLVGLDRGALRVAIGAAGWFGGSFRSSTNPSVGGDLRAASGVLEVCAVPTIAAARRVSFPLCAAGTGGAIIGTGVGVPDPATVARPWLAAGGDVGIRVRVHPRVALRLGVGVLASLVRPVWEIAGPAVSFTTPPVLGRLRLGIEPILTRP